MTAALALGGFLYAMPAWTPVMRDQTGAVLPNSIATIESIELNGVQQWLVIRGRDRSNPVLLYLRGGPGTSETALLTAYDRALENEFVVVSWDVAQANPMRRVGRPIRGHRLSSYWRTRIR